MQFDECKIGDHRIYAGAVEGRRGDGYTVTLIIETRRPGQPADEVFRDESMACGHRWPTTTEALAYAMQKGRGLVQQKPRSTLPSSAAASC